MDVWRQFGALVKHLAVPPGTAGLSEKAYPNINVAPGGSCNRQRCWDGLRPKAAVFTWLRQTVDDPSLSTSGLNAASHTAACIVSISWRGMSRKPLIWFDNDSKLAISFRVYYLKRVKLAWTSSRLRSVRTH